jgi:hypothetical protein
MNEFLYGLAFCLPDGSKSKVHIVPKLEKLDRSEAVRQHENASEKAKATLI